MDPITPSSSNPSSNVDSLLNDILSGQPADDAAMSTPSTPPPTPDPHAVPTISAVSDDDSLSERIARETMKDEAEDTAERIHDMLEGESEPKQESQVDPGMTPVVKESRLDSIATMPTMPMDVDSAPMAMPTMSATLSPMAPVAPVTQMSSTAAQTPSQPQVAQAPKPSVPKAGIAAALVVLAVTIAGVGAGVALSGQEQDNRNQAYVAPAQRTGANMSGSQTTQSSVVAPTIDQSFESFRQQFPSSQQVALSGDVTGNAFYAKNENIGSWQFFVELESLPSEDGKVHFAWVEANGEVYPLSSFEVGQNGKAYASGLVSAEVQNGKVIISLETPGSDIFGLLPSQELTSTSF